MQNEIRILRRHIVILYIIILSMAAAMGWVLQNIHGPSRDLVVKSLTIDDAGKSEMTLTSTQLKIKADGSYATFSPSGIELEKTSGHLYIALSDSESSIALAHAGSHKFLVNVSDQSRSSLQLRAKKGLAESVTSISGDSSESSISMRIQEDGKLSQTWYKNIKR